MNSVSGDTNGFIPISSAGAAPTIPATQAGRLQRPISTGVPAATSARSPTSRGTPLAPTLLDRIAELPQTWGCNPNNFELADSPANLAALHISSVQADVIRRWAKAVGWRVSWGAQGEGLLSVLSQLLVARGDGSTQRGVATWKALADLGIVSPYGARMVPWLYGNEPGPPIPSSVHFHYNGHLTREVLGMAVGLDYLGLRSFSMSRVAMSGDRAVAEILATRQQNGSSVDGDLARYASTRAEPAIDTFREDAEESSLIDRIRSGMRQNKVWILDKVSDLISDGELPADILKGIASGQVRFIIHNRNDRDALERLPGPIRKSLWAVDLSQSDLKAYEAKIIGEQLARMAAQELQHRTGSKSWGSLQKTPIVIVGHGLLGSAITGALLRLKVPAKNIFIQDTDPAVEGEASKRFSILSRSPPLSSAVVFIATPGKSLDAKLARSLARKNLVIGVTSGGKGVDWSSLNSARTLPLKTVRERQAGFHARSGEPAMMQDVAVQISSDRGPVSLEILAQGYPLNLVDPWWWQRHEPVTGAGGALTFAVLRAARMSKPGIVDPRHDEAWRRFEAAAFKQVCEHG